jgi:hypothetical protein
MRSLLCALLPLTTRAWVLPSTSMASAASTRSGQIVAVSQDELKKQVGYKAVDDYVKSGTVIGLGTGSTAAFAVERVGQLLKEGTLKDIIAIPTSVRTKEQAEELGIPLSTLDEYSDLDVAIDGADEVDPDFNLVKGGGGALLREKMVEVRAAPRRPAHPIAAPFCLAPTPSHVSSPTAPRHRCAPRSSSSSSTSRSCATASGRASRCQLRSRHSAGSTRCARSPRCPPSLAARRSCALARPLPAPRQMVMSPRSPTTATTSSTSSSRSRLPMHPRWAALDGGVVGV